MEPTLSDIANISADSERGGVDAPYIIDNRDIVRNLTQTAVYKAENDKYKYNTFLGEVNKVYQDIGSLAEMDVATQDLPELKKQMAEVLNNVYKDPKEFFSGAGNQKRMLLQQKLGELKRNSIESRQNRLFDMAHREYIMRNPDLNTDENKAKVESFWGAPLGQRKPYTLDIDNPVDLMALGKTINEQVKTPYAKTGLSPDGKYIMEQKGTEYDPKKYMALAQQSYDLPGKQGQLIRTGVEKLFSKLDPSIQKQYGDPKKFYLDVMKNQIRNNEVSDSGLKADPYGLEILENKNRYALEFYKDKLDKQASPEQSTYLIDYAKSVYNNKTGRTLAVDKSKGKEAPDYVTEDVINSTPELLTIFSKPVKRTVKSTDILGEESTTESQTLLPPDALTRTADGKIRRVFYKRDDNGQIQQKDGHPILDSHDEVPINETLSLIGKTFLDKKSLPSAVNYATKELSKVGGNINEYGKEPSVVAQRVNPQETAPHPLPSGQPKTIKQSGYTYTYNEATGKYE